MQICKLQILSTDTNCLITSNWCIYDQNAQNRFLYQMINKQTHPHTHTRTRLRLVCYSLSRTNTNTQVAHLLFGKRPNESHFTSHYSAKNESQCTHTKTFICCCDECWVIFLFTIQIVYSNDAEYRNFNIKKWVSKRARERENKSQHTHRCTVISVSWMANEKQLYILSTPHSSIGSVSYSQRERPNNAHTYM